MFPLDDMTPVLSPKAHPVQKVKFDQCDDYELVKEDDDYVRYDNERSLLLI